MKVMIKLKKIIKYALLTIVCYYSIIFFTPLSNKLAEGLSVKPDLRKADVIIILSGGLTKSTKELNSSTLSREIHGIILWRKRYAPHIIFSGGAVSPYHYEDSVYMAKLARDLGVPEESIIIEKKSRSTHENAEESLSIMKKRGWRKALLVTSGIHMKRAKWLFNNCLNSSNISIFPAPTPFSERFAKSVLGRYSLFKMIRHEYLGLMAYKNLSREWLDFLVDIFHDWL